MASSRTLSSNSGAIERLSNEPRDFKPLRLLLVEDSEDDALLVIYALQRGGYELTYERVDTQRDFRRALTGNRWDIIISDHTIPGYGGLYALADLRETGKDIPFILVSGTIGEAMAVNAMKAGAQDYVLKDDLTRLPVAVEREIREAGLRAEQVRMREQLVISERMASAGTLAAGVAHEINNPLAIAMVNLDSTMTSLARMSEVARDLVAHGSRGAATVLTRINEMHEPLSETQEALTRIRDIVRDVKLFSRPDDETFGMVDPRRVADSSIRMAWNELRHRAKLVKDYREVPAVHANEARLGQVLLNLLVNAVHAMPEGRNDSNEIRFVTKTSNSGWAVIEVTDTGCGIPKENLTRIFDPFFTTKPVGIGTGLGLAICHRIVRELDGRIEVESEVGRGTTFRIVLPAARESPAVLKVARPEAPARARARVLVVDDEVALGRAIRRSLTAHHDVTLATSGPEALDLITKGERFDVIVLDVMMPHMSGMDVHTRLHQSHPDVAARIVFMTGGAFTPAAREFLHGVPNPRLDKPIDLPELLGIIESIGPRPPA